MIDMCHFTVNMAGLSIKINTVSPKTFCYCMKYLSSEEPDISVSITEEDIQNEITEKKLYAQPFNDTYLETIVAYRKIVEKTLRFNTILMHGAVIGIGNSAIMFSAPSGTGKTTHIKLWLENVQDAYVINGDKPLIRLEGERVLACGTPWCGKERLGTNAIVPLKAIVFLERNNDNIIKAIPNTQAFTTALSHTYIPSDVNMAERTVKLVSDLCNKVSFWYFQCNNFKKDCFDVSYSALAKLL